MISQTKHGRRNSRKSAYRSECVNGYAATYEKFAGFSARKNEFSSKTTVGNGFSDIVSDQVFQAKKKNIQDLTEDLCTYLWFRRIREIFLVMGRVKDDFMQRDMELAREDMIDTCEKYLDSELARVRVG